MDKRRAQEFDMILDTCYTATPDVTPETVGPVTDVAPWWHQASKRTSRPHGLRGDDPGVARIDLHDERL